jgi:methyl halide transferase
MLLLDDRFWSERYTQHQTGWDIGMASPALTEYADQLHNKHLKILIPGCGNAHEAKYLIDNSYSNITLLDISETLVASLKKRFAGSQVNLIHADFFEHNGTYDLILEQTFFCALQPSKRSRYVDKMHELLTPGGTLAGVLFNRQFEGGPPFGGHQQEYHHLFQKKFNIKTLEICHNSIAQRKNVEVFLIAKKLQ